MSDQVQKLRTEPTSVMKNVSDSVTNVLVDTTKNNKNNISLNKCLATSYRQSYFERRNATNLEQFLAHHPIHP